MTKPKLTGVAKQIKKLGLVVGDTIFGRQEDCEYWHEAKLTLLWVGNKEAVWLESERGTGFEKWSKKQESTAWTLDCRKWTKVPKAAP